MGVEKYQILFLMFLALQHQFTRFIEHRPELMEEGLGHVARVYDDHTGLTYELVLDLDYLNLDMDTYHDLQKGQTNQQAVDLDSDWLNQLTELEEQTLVLEERLHRAMIKVLRSQRCMSRSWKDVRNIQGRLNKLQAELRAAIETLEGGSTGRYRRRIFSNRRSMLEQKNQVRERSPLRFWSCPNISSMLEDMEFDILRKSVSLNRTIAFKDYLEDMLEVIDNDLNFLDMFRQYTMMKLKKTSDFPTCQSTEQAAGQGNKSDSSGVRETARNATSHSSGQSGQHHVNAMHMGHFEQHMGHRSLQSRALRVTTTAASTSGAPGHRSLQSCTPRVTTTAATTAATTFVAPGRRILQPCALRVTTTAVPTSGARRLSLRIPRAHNVTTTAATTTTTAAPTSRERIQSISLQNVSEISHSGASAQPDNESRVRKVNLEKVPTTGKNTKSSGSPSFSLTNISTDIYKTMAASCAAILIFI